MPEAIPCRCGRQPERNASLDGYICSLSCKCGTDEINFVTRSDSEANLFDNWESLIARKPYKHRVAHLKSPSDRVEAWRPPEDLAAIEARDPDPLRRYIRSTGGHCSGGGGPC